MVYDLSPRQREVAELVAEGLPNEEVAERLGISRRTVMTHLGEVYAKTGIGGRDGSARVRLAVLLRQDRHSPATHSRRTAGLTAKETEAAVLSATGVPRPAIARRLDIDPHVLDARLRMVRRKAGIDGGEGWRERLAAWLADQGLLPATAPPGALAGRAEPARD